MKQEKQENIREEQVKREISKKELGEVTGGAGKHDVNPFKPSKR